jgi:catechol 2,3-dioxygenase-like lactoylglutathione lyase family enzyme
MSSETIKTDKDKQLGLRIGLVSLPVTDPIKAHKFYTEILGFQSKQFIEKAQIAIVVSKHDPDGTQILLEPCGMEFAKVYQKKVYDMGLPHMVFNTTDVAAEVKLLKSKGVKFRDDLTRTDWGLDNIFEDTCGNFIMLQQTK